MIPRIIIVAVLAAVSFTLSAQDSLSVQPVPSLSEGQYGTPGTPDEKEERVEIRSQELPGKMLDALNRSEKYAGWEKSPVYFEKNTDQYVVSVVAENTTQTFRFDKEGNEITTKGSPSTEEQRH